VVLKSLFMRAGELSDDICNRLDPCGSPVVRITLSVYIAHDEPRPLAPIEFKCAHSVIIKYDQRVYRLLLL
jgi:hypothetical protein